MTLQEKVYFLKQLQNSYTSIGALIPTSRYAARAMVAECARFQGPRTILEVGPGTGSITAGIVEQLRPEDRLVLCELNTEFVAYLRERFDRDPVFQRVRDQVTILHMDVTQLDTTQRFDYIISAVPFTNLPSEVVETILSAYQTLLKPGGVLTYIEYAYMRMLKPHLISHEARRQLESASLVLDRYLERYEFRQDLVLRNLPPAWIHNLRFREPLVSDALQLVPLEDSRRIALGSHMGIATEALPWLLGLLAVALLVPLRSIRAVLGLLAAAVATFFRDPVRATRLDPSLVYAACDGKVLAVERVRDPRFGDGEWLRIVTFLSLADVHINRSPIAGKVIQLIREEGGFASANSPAAEHNHALYTVIDGIHGRCVIAQRVGLVARRIVNWSRPGTLLAQGERYGLIRFGSRTDVYLPAHHAEACVGVGDRIEGGTTVIARYIDGRAR